jgi:hypothetical protein
METPEGAKRTEVILPLRSNNHMVIPFAAPRAWAAFVDSHSFNVIVASRLRALATADDSGGLDHFDRVLSGRHGFILNDRRDFFRRPCDSYRRNGRR